MSRREDFSNAKIVDELKRDLVRRVKPLVKEDVKRRNAFRDKHLNLLNRIADLNGRQIKLAQELVELREEGAANIMDSKENLKVSIRISARESELRSNATWLSEFVPKAEAMEKELELEDKVLLEALRVQVEVIHKEKEKQMNDLLFEASKLKHSFYKAVQESIDTIGEKAHLSKGLTAVNWAFRLKVNHSKSHFVSPGK